MADNLRTILEKEVTRREFLVHVGTAILAVVGITGVLKRLTDSYHPSRDPSGKKAGDYGYNTYGGGTAIPKN